MGHKLYYTTGVRVLFLRLAFIRSYLKHHVETQRKRDFIEWGGEIIMWGLIRRGNKINERGREREFHSAGRNEEEETPRAADR